MKCPFCGEKSFAKKKNIMDGWSVIGTVESALIRSHAFCFGVPIFLCARGYFAAASVDGAIAFAGAQSPAEFTFSPMKEYHLVETRLRGFCRGVKKDF